MYVVSLKQAVQARKSRMPLRAVGNMVLNTAIRTSGCQPSRWVSLGLMLVAAVNGQIAPAILAAVPDLRNIRNGLVILDERYCDQPYVVITSDGNWLCTLTTGTGLEGQGGQHVVSTISADHGKSWSPLVEQDSRYWIAETQKSMARIHEIDRALLDGLWSQGVRKAVTRDGLLLETSERTAKLPGPLNLAETGGAAIDLWLKLDDLSAGQSLIDTRDADGQGITLRTIEQGAVRIELSDGQAKTAWDSDKGWLEAGRRHHIVAIVDAGPKIITFVVDGQLCDGGADRQFGWGRYLEPLRDVSGSAELRVATSVEIVRVYGRYLRTSEAVAGFHAGQ
jgi:hypothetical protein